CFVMCIFFVGHCCSLNDITIGTVRTGQEVRGVPEWRVTVYNTCHCTIKQVKLRCQGFKSAEAVDPKILLPQGDLCLVNNGLPLTASSSVSFSYAWDPPFVMFPSFFVTVNC
ncbi:hypothetical protein CFOL_v3_04079, partial [Cephalotus follicularis]